MDAASLTALVTALAGLATAIGAVIAAIRHAGKPHPKPPSR